MQKEKKKEKGLLSAIRERVAFQSYAVRHSGWGQE